MRKIVSYHRILVALAALGAVLLAWPTTGAAQTVTGNASVVRATVLGLLGSTTTELASTGSLTDSTDARQASQTTGGITSLLTGETLHATTIGWPDEAASEASVAALALNVAGSTIGADYVMGRALATSDAGGSGVSNIDNLSINGIPIDVTGEPNQTISIPGGEMVINEQLTSAGGIVVNALHVVVYGVADVVVGSAAAAIQ